MSSTVSLSVSASKYPHPAKPAPLVSTCSEFAIQFLLVGVRHVGGRAAPSRPDSPNACPKAASIMYHTQALPGKSKVDGKIWTVDRVIPLRTCEAWGGTKGHMESAQAS